MSSDLDPKALHGILTREIENYSIQYLQPMLYHDSASILASLKGQGYDGIEARVKEGLVKLISEMITSLFQIRVEKIRQNKIDYSNLTSEEQYVAISQKEFGMRFEQVLSATVEGRVGALEIIVNKARTARVLLRFLQPVGKLSASDRGTYGPFEEEDIAVLPFEDAKKLLEQGVAVEIPLSYT